LIAGLRIFAAGKTIGFEWLRLKSRKASRQANLRFPLNYQNSWSAMEAPSRHAQATSR